MQVEIEKTKGYEEERTPYVARICGFDRKYRLDRDFLSTTQSDLSFGERQQLGKCKWKERYDLKTNELYEISRGGEREYIYVCGKEFLPVDEIDLMVAEERFRKTRVTLPRILRRWKRLRKEDPEATFEAAVDSFIEERKPKSKRRRKTVPGYRRKCATVYHGSQGGATRSYLSALEKCGHIGRIAAELFRAQKSSRRAKQYRGDSVEMAYNRKGDSLEKLCSLLEQDSCGLSWGWQRDTSQPFASHVLYVDSPEGQISFHSPKRFSGSDYPGEWDSESVSEEVVIHFCNSVMKERHPKRGGSYKRPSK